MLTRLKIDWLIYKILLVVCFFVFSYVSQAKEAYPESTFDGLVLKPDSKITAVYINPAADFSQYIKIILLDLHVAFNKDWRRQHRRLTYKDVETIKNRIKVIFHEEFTKVLKNGGYRIVEQPDEDVLLLKPAIIDIDIYSPVDSQEVTSISYKTDVGAATLFLEMYDSITNEILARAIDKRILENTTGNWMKEGASFINTNEGRKTIKYWATLLKNGLDNIRGK